MSDTMALGHKASVQEDISNYTNSIISFGERGAQSVYVKVLKFSKCSVRRLYSKFLKIFYKKICAHSPNESGLQAQATEVEMLQFAQLCKSYKQSIEQYKLEQKISKEKAETQVILDKKEFVSYYEKKFMFDQCRSDFFNLVSLNNRHETEDRRTTVDKFVLPAIELLIGVCLIVGTLVFDYWHEKYYLDHVNKKVSIGDFTLMIENLPYGNKYKGKIDLEEELKKLIERDERNHGLFSYSKTFEIKEISFAYDFQKYQKFKEKMHNLQAKKFRASLETQIDICKQRTISSTLAPEEQNLVGRDAKIEAEIENANKNLLEELQKFKQKDISKMVGVAFVTLSYAKDVDYLVKRYQDENCLDSMLCCLKKRRLRLADPVRGGVKELKISRAIEPGDIQWENLGFSKWQLNLRELFSWLLIDALLLIGVMIVYKFETLKVKKFIRDF